MYKLKPFNPYGTAENQVLIDLNSANDNFDELYFPTSYSARYYFGSSYPNNAVVGSIFYNESEGNLYRFNGSSFVKLDFHRYIYSSSDELRFSDGFLEVKSGDGNFYRVKPLLGANSFVVVQSLDNISMTDKFYLLPNTSVRFLNSVSYIPLYFHNGVYDISFSVAVEGNVNIGLQNGLSYYDSSVNGSSFDSQVTQSVSLLKLDGFPYTPGTISIYRKSVVTLKFIISSVGNFIDVNSVSSSVNGFYNYSRKYISFNNASTVLGVFKDINIDARVNVRDLTIKRLS